MAISFQRLYQGDPWRKSRFHDTKGNFVGANSLLSDVPRTVVAAAIRRLTGRLPTLPWIPYPAIRAMQDLTKRNWQVLEHGSGMSTIWWAQLVSHVQSIEANPVWHARVSEELKRRGLTNVNVSLRTGQSYSDLSSFADSSFDFIVIDGHDRQIVASQSLRILKRPGWIYLDDSDRSAQWHEMYGEAEDILLQIADRESGGVTYFTGLAPATFIARQGMLVAIP